MPEAADRYFLIEQYGSRRHAATVEFLSGTSIAGPCETLVSYDGEIQYKYTVAAGAKEPVFAAKGAEAGLFIDSADSGNAIELDGFGRMSSGGKSYRYTAEGPPGFSPPLGVWLNHTFTRAPCFRLLVSESKKVTLSL